MQRLAFLAAALALAASPASATTPMEPGVWGRNSEQASAWIVGTDGAHLTVGCARYSDGRASNMYLTVTPMAYIGGAYEYRPGSARFDGGAEMSGNWLLTERTATVSMADFPSHLRKLLSARTAVFRFTSIAGQSIEATFTVAGGREAITSAFAACGVPKTW